MPLTARYFAFRDRRDAGKQLAEKLVHYTASRPIILAIPRGGVRIGYEIAKRLNAPLDTIVVRKIGAPFNRELVVGAIAPGDVLILDDRAIESLNIERGALEPVIDREMREMDRRMVTYRSGEYSSFHTTDTVIIVDDGLATGVSARAAIESVRLINKPSRIVFATAVCSSETAGTIRELVDDLVCVHQSDKLVAIGYWYRNFSPATDDEITYYLGRARAHRLGAFAH